MKFAPSPELERLAQKLTHEGPECSVRTRIELYTCKDTNRDKKLRRELETAYNDEVSHSPPLPSFMQHNGEHTMTAFGLMQDHSTRKTLFNLIGTLNLAYPDHDFSHLRPSHFSKEDAASVLNSLSTTLVSPNRAGPGAPRSYSSYPPISHDFFPSSVPTSSSPIDYALPSPYAPSRSVSGTHPSLYRSLDGVIGLNDCEVFSYNPDMELDPHADDFSDDEDDVASVGDEDSSSEDEGTFEFDEDVSRAGSHQRSGLVRMKRRGGMLWSSHWFFVNKKMKRIMFITVWARSKGIDSWMDEDESFSESVAGERFFGWAGAVGAGARAMGLTV